MLGHTSSETYTSGYSRWDNYVRTQWIGQLHHEGWDSYEHSTSQHTMVTLGHSKWNSYIRTQ